MQQKNWIILLIIVICQLLVVLDSSIMVTALPQIGRSMHMTETSLTWVQNAYILPLGGFLLLGARAGDLMGRRRILIIGIGLFSLASMLVGLAPTAEFLLVFRAFQGFAAALATPAALALLSASFVEAKERARAIAIYSAVMGGGGSVGLLLGGFFTDFISWRAGMFINVPIGIALLYLVQRFIQQAGTRTGRFDLWGAIVSVIGMTALVYGFVQAADHGWGEPATWGSLAVGIVLLVAFVFIESRAAAPIIPLRLFANRQRSGAYLGRFLLVCGNFSLFFFIPQYLQNVFGFSSLESGLAFLPFTVAQFGMMYLIPRLVQRYGNRKVLIAGLVLGIVGTLWMSRIVSLQAQFFPQMFILLAIIGIGAGLAIQSLTVLGLSDVDPQDSGAASGLINVAHHSGSSLGLAVLITVFEAAIGSHQFSKIHFAQAISDSLLGSAIFAALALVTAWFCTVPLRQPARKQTLTDS